MPHSVDPSPETREIPALAGGPADKAAARCGSYHRNRRRRRHEPVRRGKGVYHRRHKGPGPETATGLSAGGCGSPATQGSMARLGAGIHRAAHSASSGQRRASATDPGRALSPSPTNFAAKGRLPGTPFTILSPLAWRQAIIAGWSRWLAVWRGSAHRTVRPDGGLPLDGNSRPSGRRRAYPQPAHHDTQDHARANDRPQRGPAAHVQDLHAHPLTLRSWILVHINPPNDLAGWRGTWLLVLQ
jgi:hypothetical protein